MVAAALVAGLTIVHVAVESGAGHDGVVSPRTPVTAAPAEAERGSSDADERDRRDHGGSSEIPPSLAFVDPCRPSAEVADVRDALDALAPDWAAGDLMDRVELPDGRVLWVFGDTFVGAVASDRSLRPGWRMVRSSAVVQRGRCFEAIEGWAGGSWLPSIERGVAVWPQSAVVIGDELVVHAVRVRHDPDKSAGLDFEQVGGEIQVFSLDDLSVPTSLIPSTPAIAGRPFGWGARLEGDHVFVEAHHDRQGTRVARYRPDRIADVASWEFWDGRRWSDEIADAHPVVDRRLHVAPTPDGGYVGLALPYLDQELHQFAAPEPHGPWRLVARHDLDAVARVGSEPTWMYQPLVVAHGRDEMLVSLNHLPYDPSALVDDVRLYGPRFVEVAVP